MVTIANLQCQLGEGPVWDTKRNAILWIDILEGKIHEFTFWENSLKIYQLDEMIGSLAICKNGKLVTATKSGFGYFDRETSQYEHVINPEIDQHQNRFNDGKCDPLGRFWAGTMSLSEEKGAGNLYVFENNKCIKKLINLTISNGLAWSLDNKIMYFIDTPTMQVMAYNFDIKTGNISEGKTIISFPAKEGYPDGMTIDNEGMLWIAHWDGWQISRWNPETGEKLCKIDLPVARVTSCTFGGENYNDLFITTAKVGLSECELKKQPLAGSLFMITNCKFTGIPPLYFEG